MYQPIKFGCKRISSLADKVETVIFDQMGPHCVPKLEDGKPVFLHDTLACDVASPYQVWLQKVQQLRRYCPDEHSLEFWTFPVTLSWSSRQTFTEILNLCCDLDLKLSNPIFPLDTPAYDAVLSKQVWLQTDQQFRRYNRSSRILII